MLKPTANIIYYFVFCDLKNIGMKPLKLGSVFSEGILQYFQWNVEMLRNSGSSDYREDPYYRAYWIRTEFIYQHISAEHQCEKAELVQLL